MDRSKITVIIVDDHPVVLHGITNFLNKYAVLSLVGFAHDCPEAMNVIEHHKPDVALLDISLKKLSGLDLLKEIRKVSPKTQVIIYTNHSNQNYIQRAFKQGARGYALKSDPLQEVVEAITLVNKGRLYLSANLPENTLECLIHGTIDGDSSVSKLTPREYEIANLLSQGQSVQDIAKTLFISPKTVWVHRSNIMQKISCTQSSELLIRLLEYFPQH
jgi:DNA-binding NarL/FixJ family response regulator